MVGEGTHFGVRGIETAGFDDSALPLVAVKVEDGERSDLNDGLGLSEVRLGLVGLELFQCCLLGGIGTKGVFIGGVGRGPESILEREGVVVGGR